MDNQDIIDDPTCGLKGKQKRFCEEYAECLTGTDAAQRASYAGDDNVLAATASRLLRNVKVRSYINYLLENKTIAKEEILGRLTAQATADMGLFLDPTTLTLDLERAKSLGLTHLIKKLKQTTTITKAGEEKIIIEVELHDSQSALVHLGRTYGMFTDKTDLTTGGKPLRSARELTDDELAEIITRHKDV